MPALSITTSSFNESNFSATADAFNMQATNIFLASKQLVNVLVPLVVVITIVFPSTISFVYSNGELDKSKPSIFTAFLSPPNIHSFSPMEAFNFRASSIVNVGITFLHPFINAVVITEVALSISITTTTLFSIRSFLI